jgi:hypothetical protein
MRAVSASCPFTVREPVFLGRKATMMPSASAAGLLIKDLDFLRNGIFGIADLNATYFMYIYSVIS